MTENIFSIDTCMCWMRMLHSRVIPAGAQSCCFAALSLRGSF